MELDMGATERQYQIAAANGGAVFESLSVGEFFKFTEHGSHYQKEQGYRWYKDVATGKRGKVSSPGQLVFPQTIEGG